MNDGYVSFTEQKYVKIADYLMDYDPKLNYGFGGYQGYSVDMALHKDDPEAILKAHDLGWIGKDTQTMIGSPIRWLAAERGWVKCAAKLEELGYPLWKTSQDG